MENKEENNFKDSEEESEEIGEPEKQLQDIIDETPQTGFTPGLRPSSLQEITPVLDQAVTGGAQERGFRRVFIQDDEEQESGVYETQSQGETIGRTDIPRTDAYQEARESGAYKTAESSRMITGMRNQVIGEQSNTLGPSMGQQNQGIAGGIGSINQQNNQGANLDSLRDYESDEKKKRDKRMW